MPVCQNELCALSMMAQLNKDTRDFLPPFVFGNLARKSHTTAQVMSFVVNLPASFCLQSGDSNLHSPQSSDEALVFVRNSTDREIKLMAVLPMTIM